MTLITWVNLAGWTVLGALLGVLVAGGLDDVATNERLREPGALKAIKRLVIGLLAFAFAICAAISALVAS